MAAIDLVDLTKSYGTPKAVDGVSLSVSEGELVGILGPHGAGKTTTLEIAEELRQPEAGSATILGEHCYAPLTPPLLAAGRHTGSTAVMLAITLGLRLPRPWPMSTDGLPPGLVAYVDDPLFHPIRVSQSGRHQADSGAQVCSAGPGAASAEEDTMDDYPLLNLFWTMLWFFLFVAWIWLLISLVTDILSRRDLSGWAKALWTLVIIVIPLLGALIYLIAHGRGMARRSVEEQEGRERAFRAYVRDAAGTTGSSTADELTKLAQLRDAGTITSTEFEAQKAKLLT